MNFTFAFGIAFKKPAAETVGMSQSTFDDDDLFSEGADEMRADVERHLDAAKAELPSAAEVWDTDAENVLGVLNALKGALDVGDAADELRQAKKWYVIGERADAFEDAADLKTEIESVGELIEQISDAKEQVGSLAGTIPALKSALDDAESDSELIDEGDDTAEAAESDD